MNRIISCLFAAMFFGLYFGFGLYVDINISSTSIAPSHNITINYTINLDKEELTNYVIMLRGGKNIVIENQTMSFKELSRTLSKELGVLEAGNYELVLIVNNNDVSITKKFPKNITILRNSGVDVKIPDRIVVNGDQTTQSIVVRNSGNTNLTVSVYSLGAYSDVSIHPQSFFLDVHQTKEVSVIVQKPAFTYNMTFYVVAIGDKKLSYQKQVEIVIPNVNITLSPEIQNTKNETIVNVVLSNDGNVDVNGTLMIRRFQITQGFNTTNYNVVVPRGSQLNKSIVLPKSTILSVKFKYFNGTSDHIKSKSYSILDKVPLDIKFTKDKLLIFGVLVLVVFLFFLSKRKKHRP